MLTQILTPRWKHILRSNFIHLSKLADFLELTEDQRNRLLARSRFVLNLPLRLAEKIEKGNLEDPIFKQFVPTELENDVMEGFVSDPVGDGACRVEKKLIHKYEGRVLLVTTGACAMHCRYCFRQNFEYEVQQKGFDEAVELIAADASIHEVILSGGDPLSLDDQVLEGLLRRLANIPHVRNIRFHTRFPIGIPERINESFLKLLESVPVQFWFIVHVNHPRELDEDVLAALKSMQKLGIPVLNQSVLLKGVNDDVEVLAELYGRLINHGIMPYYLHQLDRVKGTAHFEVKESEGVALVNALSKRLPGYAVPKYVREVAGMPAKVSIAAGLEYTH